MSQGDSSGPSDSSATASPAAELAKTIVWLLRLQAGLTVAVTVGFLLWMGAQAAFAALAGGLIGIILTAIAALRLLQVGTDDAAVIVRGFYRAMAVKLAVAMLVFVVVAVQFAAWFGPIMSGYVATLMAYWVALWRLARVAVPVPPADNRS